MLVERQEETSDNTKLMLRKLAGPTTFRFSLYRNAINDFILGAGVATCWTKKR